MEISPAHPLIAAECAEKGVLGKDDGGGCLRKVTYQKEQICDVLRELLDGWRWLTANFKFGDGGSIARPVEGSPEDQMPAQARVEGTWASVRNVCHEGALLECHLKCTGEMQDRLTGSHQTPSGRG